MTTESTTAQTDAPRWGELAGVTLSKGHGTGNDFLLLTDPEGSLELEAELVAAVCDRHRGIGADGLIRAIRSEHLEAGRALAANGEDAPEWFMDYRNADGSLSEMCGNGVRVFAHHLIHAGLIELPEGATVRIGTRGGVKTVARVPGRYAVDMGPLGFIDGEQAREHGADCTVSARGLRTARPGLSITMGNPHTVVALADEAKLARLDLGTAPTVDPRPSAGTNVEFVVPRDAEEEDDGTGALVLRVSERGVGETLSCGTGACAAAAATRFWGGEDAPDEWRVGVPGGELGVTFVLGPDELEHVILSGPAELVGTVRLG